MRPTSGLCNGCGSSMRLIKLRITLIRVRLHDAGITSKMPLRMFSSTVARIFEEGCRRILAAERPVVADIGPKPAGDRFHLCQNRHLRIVRMNAFRSQHMGSERLNKRLKRDYAGADTIGERGCVDLNAFSCIGGALTV